MYHDRKRERVYVDKVVNRFWFVRSFSSQHHSKLSANNATENVSQVRNKKCKTRSFICKVNLNFLRSSRHFNYDSRFAVIVFFLNAIVHGFDNICHGRVKTRFQTVGLKKFRKSFNQKHKLSLCDILVH